MAFTNEQLERYSRHIILKEIGVKGQKKLLNSSVLIIGAGGLGAPAAMYLAAAGVGKIGIADADVVDLSNLQRQVIHSTNDIGKPKVESAAETMRAINPDVEVVTYHDFVTSENILDMVKEYDPPKGAVPTCKEAGVVGAMGGVIGSLQAMEAVKYITGVGELLVGYLLTYDALTMEFRKVKLPKRGKGCAICSDNPTIHKLIDYEQPTCEFKPGGNK